MQEIVEIAITGGPCAGTSSILSTLQQKISDFGLDVYTTDEAATGLIRRGAFLKRAMGAKDKKKMREYQKMIIRRCMADEAEMRRCAEIEGRRAVILCDRGIPDSRAYLPEGTEGDLIYEGLLEECKSSAFSVLESYKAVIKLTTAADGALPFYTLANNTARDETPEVACYLDKRIEEAYMGHQHLRVIDNSTDFEEKKLRALKQVCHALGIPAPIEIERKYKIRPPKFSHLPAYRVTDIEQMYLCHPDEREQVRIRRRSQGERSTYYLTTKKFLEAGVRQEVERQISWREYLDFMAQRDPARGIICKKRYCFLWRGQYFELDMFENVEGIRWILEVELTESQEEVMLPPFIDVIEEVTNDEAYSNRNFALRVK